MRMEVDTAMAIRFCAVASLEVDIKNRVRHISAYNPRMPRSRLSSSIRLYIDKVVHARKVISPEKPEELGSTYA